VAIVGENGAGKTTLVKLLCRFYAPTTGTITVDGVALDDLDPVGWRDRTAAGFQDFCRFELLARQNVGVGDLPRIGSDEAVLVALERAHSSDVLDRLDDGLDTQLGTSHADGAELSGGQWQKLALGRAMMRESPLLVVLDEPTSALDARTEAALLEALDRLANGRTSFIIAHRLSTIRNADRILVVDDGRIVEQGRHLELLDLGGIYAELYATQFAQSAVG